MLILLIFSATLLYLFTCYSHSIYIAFYLRVRVRPVFYTGQIMNAETQAENRNSHEALQATLKNGQEKNRESTLIASF